MNQLLAWLKGGTLQSDGFAEQAADFVIQHPELLDDLLEGLESSDNVVRGRAADALERVARVRPLPFVEHLPRLASLARRDPVPMVRWHLAMLFADLIEHKPAAHEIFKALSILLYDPSAFVTSWAISGLCILGRRYPARRPAIVWQLGSLGEDRSAAVRNRVGKALRLLLNDQLPLPKGWVKSPSLRESL